MGIRNLLRWTQHISKPNIMDTCAWNALSGKRVGVDILSFLYKSRMEDRHMLEAIYTIMTALQSHNITPIVVFDGKMPQEKKGTRSARRRQHALLTEEEQKRMRVSSDDRNQVKQLFYALGILAVNAEMEADTVLAYLYRRGDIAAVISSDMDFLPRGVEQLIMPHDVYNIYTWHTLTLTEILRNSKLIYEQFVEMCVLMGCDYAPTIPTLSYQSCYWLIREGRSMLEILAKEGIRTATAWITAVDILTGKKDRWESILSERQQQKWAEGPPLPEPNAEILHACFACSC